MPATLFVPYTKPVGVSLLAIAFFRSLHQRLTDRHREQAHSYKGTVVSMDQRNAAIASTDSRISAGPL